jgi:hypothetical protein
MAPHGLTMVLACSLGARAERSGLEDCSEHAGKVPIPLLHDKIELLATGKLQPKHLCEAVCRKQLPNVPLVLPPSQSLDEIWCETGPKRPSVSEVSIRSIEHECKTRELYPVGAGRFPGGPAE